MEGRKLRIVKTSRDLPGVGERCGARFESALRDQGNARSETAIAFDAHQCLPLDRSQNALRVAREATENK